MRQSAQSVYLSMPRPRLPSQERNQRCAMLTALRRKPAPTTHPFHGLSIRIHYRYQIAISFSVASCQRSMRLSARKSFTLPSGPPPFFRQKDCSADDSHFAFLPAPLFAPSLHKGPHTQKKSRRFAALPYCNTTDDMVQYHSNALQRILTWLHQPYKYA